MLGVGLSNLQPTKRPDQAELESSKGAVKPWLPQDEVDPPEFEPESGLFGAFVVSQSSLVSREPSYFTYRRREDLKPGEVGHPDRNLHNYGQRCLNDFLHYVSRRPRTFRKDVNDRRGEPMSWWERCF